jgi:hypothetical protein
VVGQVLPEVVEELGNLEEGEESRTLEVAGELESRAVAGEAIEPGQEFQIKEESHRRSCS